MASINGFVKVATVADFANRNQCCIVLDGKKIALFKVGEKYFAIDNTCSHAGGSLCDGTLTDNVIRCPMHGAKFNIETGAVVGPPAVRPQASYAVRVHGDDIEIYLAATTTEEPKVKPQKHRKQFFLFLPVPLLFWLLQFCYQYFFLLPPSPNNLPIALVRSFALAGATLISAALFSSAVFMWRPKLSDYWRIRRYLGVSGFVCILFHALSVYQFYFAWDLGTLYYSFNPLKNPIVFGSIAFPIFMAMALISTDWAFAKLGKWWKRIHRLVYIAYLSSIFHFLLVNPPILRNVAGYLLLAMTTLAVLGELYWFFVFTMKEKKYLSWGTLYGLALIATAIILAFAAFGKM